MKSYSFAKVSARGYLTEADYNNKYIITDDLKLIINVSVRDFEKPWEFFLKRDIIARRMPLMEKDGDMGYSTLLEAVRELVHWDEMGMRSIVCCAFGVNRSRAVVEAFHYAKMGFHFEDEYEGFTNHLIYNCESGFLPPIKEVERDLASIATRNQFAKKAIELHRLIAPQKFFHKYIHEPEKVLAILDKITIKEGNILRCHNSSRRHDYTGDNSFLYVNHHNESESDVQGWTNIDSWKNILVEPCEMGLWQVYLLMTSIHVMPFWWHGGYKRRTFIFNQHYLKAIGKFDKYDLSNICKDSPEPDVKITRKSDDICSGLITCTYWNEWKGLVRETVFIEMKGNQITKYGPICSDVLFEFHSLLCY